MTIFMGNIVKFQYSNLSEV